MIATYIATTMQSVSSEGWEPLRRLRNTICGQLGLLNTGCASQRLCDPSLAYYFLLPVNGSVMSSISCSDI